MEDKLAGKKEEDEDEEYEEDEEPVKLVSRSDQVAVWLQTSLILFHKQLCQIKSVFWLG